MVRRSVLVRATVLPLVAGCSLLSPLDGLVTGELADGGTASDASTPVALAPPEDASAPVSPRDGGRDAGDETDAEDATADPPIANLHPDGTFESGCGGWTTYQASAAGDATARTGAGSCRVCATAGAAGVFGINDVGVVSAPPMGAAYRARAFVRSAGGTVAPGGVTIMVRTFSNPPFVQIDQSTSPPTAIDSGWRAVETTLVITKAAPSLQVAVAGDVAAGACFLVDDVVLERVP